MQLWYTWLHAHHEGEEAILFPGIERLSGEKGIMEANIEQHKAFHDGLDAFGKHCDALVANPKNFNGQQILQLIDAFGSVLTQHLTEEIDTLLGLRRFGEEKMKDLLKLGAEEAGTVMVSPIR
jgi:hemerythrin-like domain-containing protein